MGLRFGDRPLQQNIEADQTSCINAKSMAEILSFT
jgi:hypothetical protein